MCVWKDIRNGCRYGFGELDKEMNEKSCTNENHATSDIKLHHQIETLNNPRPSPHTHDIARWKENNSTIP